MAELKYGPVPHNQKAFLAKARARKGFSRAYNALAFEYQVARGNKGGGNLFCNRARRKLTRIFWFS
jgi:hypothetical protein